MRNNFFMANIQVCVFWDDAEFHHLVTVQSSMFYFFEIRGRIHLAEFDLQVNWMLEHGVCLYNLPLFWLFFLISPLVNFFCFFCRSSCTTWRHNRHLSENFFTHVEHLVEQISVKINKLLQKEEVFPFDQFGGVKLLHNLWVLQIFPYRSWQILKNGAYLQRVSPRVKRLRINRSNAVGPIDFVDIVIRRLQVTIFYGMMNLIVTKLAEELHLFSRYLLASLLHFHSQQVIVVLLFLKHSLNPRVILIYFKHLLVQYVWFKYGKILDYTK